MYVRSHIGKYEASYDSLKIDLRVYGELMIYIRSMTELLLSGGLSFSQAEDLSVIGDNTYMTVGMYSVKEGV